MTRISSLCLQLLEDQLANPNFQLHKVIKGYWQDNIISYLSCLRILDPTLGYPQFGEISSTRNRISSYEEKLVFPEGTVKGNVRNGILLVRFGFKNETFGAMSNEVVQRRQFCQTEFNSFLHSYLLDGMKYSPQHRHGLNIKDSRQIEEPLCKIGERIFITDQERLCRKTDPVFRNAVAMSHGIERSKHSFGWETRSDSVNIRISELAGFYKKGD